MGKVTGYFWTLYQKEEPHPPGQLLATYVDPFQVNDYTSSEAEAEAEAVLEA